MGVLKFTLQVCTFAGCWQPNSWTSLFKHLIYKTYAMFLLSALFIFSISQFMNIIINVENSDEFTDSLYMMLTVSVAGYKQFYVWIKRKNVMMIINILNKKPFAVRESHELMIRQKFDRIAQNNTLRYLSLITVTVIIVVVTSVFTVFTNRNLTYKAWVPFNYSYPALYVLVYTHQLIGMGTSGFVNVACDSIICGLLLHICCQLEILEYRLTKVVHGEDILRDCICHHNRIFEYAYMVNNMFTKIIGIQFSASMLVICSNLYRIAMAKDSVIFISLVMYTGCILAQIFIYCWFGNEVRVKSLQFMNNIYYDIEWSVLSNSNKKGLLIIMKRAMIPIEFSSAYIITMNLDSFVALLKMSYSAFNLLHQTQE
ncbi:odorant receptor 46a isoform X2 [Monomorium pharaonis]|uniref:odorant receptor 46a isoform X2 n=1 Tax=Monomorium pharaonis TaxID=307658 RepID=UPI00063F0810|nr:odorant receptor 46a isoform X2 [Monomorium pharaonis]